jgi:hypothetical protein
MRIKDAIGFMVLQNGVLLITPFIFSLLVNAGLNRPLLPVDLYDFGGYLSMFNGGLATNLIEDFSMEKLVLLQRLIFLLKMVLFNLIFLVVLKLGRFMRASVVVNVVLALCTATYIALGALIAG